MQTFVPYIGYARCAEALDMPRLGKQRLETLQIIDSIENETGYKNHPVNDMWRGYEPALVMYGLSIVHEWRIVRQLKDETWGQFSDLAREYGIAGSVQLPSGAIVGDAVRAVSPPWVGDKDVHRSHRSNLIRKLPARYTSKFPGQDADWPYIWPKIDDSDERGYKLYLAKAEFQPGRFGDTTFLPEWLTVDEKTREVTPA